MINMLIGRRPAGSLTPAGNGQNKPDREMILLQLKDRLSGQRVETKSGA